MKIYQLLLKDFNLVLDPVFNTKEAAMLFKEKYKQRNIEIKETFIDKLDNRNYVYRIETIDEDGIYLEDEVFASKELALRSIKEHQRIVKEDIIGDNTFKYAFIETI